MLRCDRREFQRKTLLAKLRTDRKRKHRFSSSTSKLHQYFHSPEKWKCTTWFLGKTNSTEMRKMSCFCWDFFLLISFWQSSTDTKSVGLNILELWLRRSFIKEGPFNCSGAILHEILSCKCREKFSCYANPFKGISSYIYLIYQMGIATT